MWGPCAWFLSAIHFVSFWKRRLLEHKASKKAWWIVRIDQKETSFYYLIYCIYSMLWINRWCPQGRYCTKQVQNKKILAFSQEISCSCLILLYTWEVLHLGPKANLWPSAPCYLHLPLPNTATLCCSWEVALQAAIFHTCMFWWTENFHWCH